MINKEEIKKVIQHVSKNPELYKQRTSKLDKLLREEKKELVHLVNVLNVSPKRLYEVMIESGALSGIAYITFYKWIKKSIDLNSGVVEICDTAETIIDEVIEDVVLSTDESKNTIVDDRSVSQDSREIFYGFDMNNEPDSLTNPLPQIYEISKEYIFNIFTNDTSLNNEKIVHILLYEISASGENIYKKVWPFMLIKNGENIQQYYNRLQDVIDSDRNYSFGITNATASISDIAYACGCDRYKIIRQTVEF